MKYYISCEWKFPIGDYPLTEKQKNRLYIIGLIYSVGGNYYRMADGICFDDIEQALRKISND